MSKTRILVVDDDPDLQELFRAWLGQCGYDVECAADGEDGLEKASLNRPDLIISDVQMTPVDGWRFVREVRSRPEFNLVPVILLTALDRAEDRLRGFRLGADAFLTKPFSDEEVGVQVQNALRRAEAIKAGLAEQLDAQRATGADLHGALSSMGLATILSVLQAEAKSGVLTLQGSAGIGTVACRDGQPVAATCVPAGTGGGGPFRGADAAGRLLAWNDGSFSFHEGAVTGGDEINKNLSHLLLEAAVRADESRR